MSVFPPRASSTARWSRTRTGTVLSGRTRCMGEFDGLAAVVTGGASGIGLATARLLAERGARVAILDLRPEGVPAPLLGLCADVTDDAAVRAAIESAAGALGGIDILVNNA